MKHLGLLLLAISIALPVPASAQGARRKSSQTKPQVVEPAPAPAEDAIPPAQEPTPTQVPQAVESPEAASDTVVEQTTPEQPQSDSTPVQDVEIEMQAQDPQNATEETRSLEARLNGLLTYSVPLPDGWRQITDSENAVSFGTTPDQNAWISFTAGPSIYQVWMQEGAFEGEVKTGTANVMGESAVYREGIDVRQQVMDGAVFKNGERNLYLLDQCFLDGSRVLIETNAAPGWTEAGNSFEPLLDGMQLSGQGILQPCAGAAPVAPQQPQPEPEAWETYANGRFGTRIDYPESLFQPYGAPPANDDGRQFSSADKQAVMLVWGGHNALGQTVQDMMGSVLDAHLGARVLSREIGGHWFMVALQSQQQEILQVSILDADNVVHNVQIRYPASQSEDYATTARNIAATLRTPDGLKADILIEEPAPVSAAEANNMEEVFWQSIKGSDYDADFQAYLTQWPDGAYAAQAQARMSELAAGQDAAEPMGELAYWKSIQSSNDPAKFEAYLQKWPKGAFSPLARLRLSRLVQ